MKSFNILVTGANGFVGRHLVPALAELGHHVRSISIEDGDIATCPLDFPDVQHVFHLAARMFVPDSWKNPLAFYNTNVMGTANVLDFCRRQQASLTLISSYVYGKPQRLPIAEDHPIAAFNPYAHSKVLGEDLARFYEQYFGVRLAIARPFNLYGPGQDNRFLIPSLIEQVLDPAKDVIQVADKRPKRDYIHIDDLVALLIAMASENVPGVYNAGSGVSTSIEELVAIITRLTGRNKPLISRDEQRPNEVMDVIADISRAAEKLHWMPQVSLEQGIAGMLARPAG